MPADAYLKAAAADLQKAADELKQSISALQSDFKQFESEANKDINSNESEARALTARVGLQDNQNSGAAHAVVVGQLKSRADKRKDEIKQRREQMQQAIAAKEQTMNDLLREASSLNSKSGNPALR